MENLKPFSNHQNVKSSRMKSVGYENNVLEIAFNTNVRYRYYNVSELLYKQLLGSCSKGVFFQNNILKKYAEKKIGK